MNAYINVKRHDVLRCLRQCGNVGYYIKYTGIQNGDQGYYYPVLYEWLTEGNSPRVANEFDLLWHTSPYCLELNKHVLHQSGGFAYAWHEFNYELDVWDWKAVEAWDIKGVYSCT